MRNRRRAGAYGSTSRRTVRPPPADRPTPCARAQARAARIPPGCAPDASEARDVVRARPYAADRAVPRTRSQGRTPAARDRAVRLRRDHTAGGGHGRSGARRHLQSCAERSGTDSRHRPRLRPARNSGPRPPRTPVPRAPGSPGRPPRPRSPRCTPDRPPVPRRRSPHPARHPTPPRHPPRRSPRTHPVQLAPDALADALEDQPQRSARTSTRARPRPPVSSPSAHRGVGGRALVSATSRRTMADRTVTDGRTADSRSTAGRPVWTTALVTSSETRRISVSASGSSSPIPDPASRERAHLRARPTSAGSGRISSCT